MTTRISCRAMGKCAKLWDKNFDAIGQYELHVLRVWRS